MAERGSSVKRCLDFWVGVPLVATCGIAARARSLLFPKRLPELSGVQEVAILCFGAIGDLILASSLVDGMRRSCPQARITLITSQSNAAALDLLDPQVNKRVFRITNPLGIIRYLREVPRDLVIDTGQWPRFSALMSAFSGAACTVGFATVGQCRHHAYDLVVEHSRTRHELDNFLALGQALDPGFAGRPDIRVPPLPEDQRAAWQGRHLVLCHMWPSGIRSHLKRWPEHFWADLAARLIRAGYTVAFTGTRQDAPATESFLATCLPTQAASGAALSLAGQTSLAELAAMLRQARGLVSVNTGIMHLGALIGTPTVGLHGPTDPRRWGPVGSKSIALLPDRGHCAYLHLGFEYPPAAEQVLDHLPVSKVWNALADLNLPGVEPMAADEFSQ